MRCKSRTERDIKEGEDRKIQKLKEKQKKNLALPRSMKYGGKKYALTFRGGNAQDDKLTGLSTLVTDQLFYANLAQKGGSWCLKFQILF